MSNIKVTVSRDNKGEFIRQPHWTVLSNVKKCDDVPGMGLDNWMGGHIAQSDGPNTQPDMGQWSLRSLPLVTGLDTPPFRAVVFCLQVQDALLEVCEHGPHMSGGNVSLSTTSFPGGCDPSRHHWVELVHGEALIIDPEWVSFRVSEYDWNPDKKHVGVIHYFTKSWATMIRPLQARNFATVSLVSTPTTTHPEFQTKTLSELYDRVRKLNMGR